MTPWLRIEPQPYEGALVKRIAIVFFLSCCVCLSHAKDISPSVSEDPLLMQGKTLVAKNDWSAASAVLEIFVKRNPQDADGFNLLGYSYRNLRRYEESFAAYRQALTLDPKHIGAHEYIGIAYVQSGQLDKAREHLAILGKLCLSSCEEYLDLKKEVEHASKP